MNVYYINIAGECVCRSQEGRGRKNGCRERILDRALWGRRVDSRGAAEVRGGPRRGSAVGSGAGEPVVEGVGRAGAPVGEGVGSVSSHAATTADAAVQARKRRRVSRPTSASRDVPDASAVNSGCWCSTRRHCQGFRSGGPVHRHAGSWVARGEWPAAYREIGRRRSGPE